MYSLSNSHIETPSVYRLAILDSLVTFYQDCTQKKTRNKKFPWYMNCIPFIHILRGDIKVFTEPEYSVKKEVWESDQYWGTEGIRENKVQMDTGPSVMYVFYKQYPYLRQ